MRSIIARIGTLGIIAPVITLGIIAPVATMGIGLGGTLVFMWLSLPLPWMLGSLSACMIASISGLALKAPSALRSPMTAVLGVMFGAAFSPDFIALLDTLWIPALLLIPYVFISTFVGYVYLRKRGDSRVTAFCSATPAGVNDMTILAAEWHGDDRRVALVQALRVFMVVMILPNLIQFGLGYDFSSKSLGGENFAQVPVRDLVIGAAVAWFGAWFAPKLNMPAAPLTGPMLVSALLHLSGLISLTAPNELIAFAQLVIGTVIGCRFFGVDRLFLLKAFGDGLVVVGMMLCLTGMSAWFIVQITNFPLIEMILSFSPGGVAEMSLVALATGVEVALVSFHHILRMILVILLAPLIFKSIFKP